MIMRAICAKCSKAMIDFHRRGQRMGERRSAAWPKRCANGPSLPILHSILTKALRSSPTGYKLPLNVGRSVRGSRSGEMIARCVVETGTSSYYTAIQASIRDEPVFSAICGHIARDELRHYKLFYTHLKRYLEKEKIGCWKRLRIAWGRITESEDDELAYAYYAAHHDENTRSTMTSYFTKRYMSRVRDRLYRREHVERMTVMVFKAVGLKPHTLLNRTATRIMWKIIQLRAWLLRGYAEPLAA